MCEEVTVHEGQKIRLKNNASVLDITQSCFRYHIELYLTEEIITHVAYETNQASGTKNWHFCQ